MSIVSYIPELFGCTLLLRRWFGILTAGMLATSLIIPSLSVAPFLLSYATRSLPCRYLCSIFSFIYSSFFISLWFSLWMYIFSLCFITLNGFSDASRRSSSLLDAMAGKLILVLFSTWGVEVFISCLVISKAWGWIAFIGPLWFPNLRFTPDYLSLSAAKNELY